MINSLFSFIQWLSEPSHPSNLEASFINMWLISHTGTPQPYVCTHTVSILGMMNSQAHSSHAVPGKMHISFNSFSQDVMSPRASILRDVTHYAMVSLRCWQMFCRFQFALALVQTRSILERLQQAPFVLISQRRGCIFQSLFNFSHAYFCVSSDFGERKHC